MGIKNQIPFWGCMIITAVYSAAGDKPWALVWLIFAILIAVLDYTANKNNDDTNRPAH